MITITKDEDTMYGRLVEVNLVDVLQSGLQVSGFTVPFTMNNEQVTELIRLNLASQIKEKVELEAFIDSRKELKRLTNQEITII